MFGRLFQVIATMSRVVANLLVDEFVRVFRLLLWIDPREPWDSQYPQAV